MDDRDYRVGDAEREHVAGLLQQAVSDGMLTLEEFGDRMSAAMAARTRGELGVVLEDLPGMQLPGSSPSAAVPAAAATLPLKVTMSSINRAGRWMVPERITVRSRFSNIVLDLTQAEIRTPVVTLEIDDICSSIDILIPDNFTADVNDLHCLVGSAHSRVDAAPPAGRVHLVVRGNVRFGALTVKHPFGAWLRKKMS
ncbi:MAG: DUF1707 domain-containing protein [Mycobacterium sp.]